MERSAEEQGCAVTGLGRVIDCLSRAASGGGPQVSAPDWVAPRRRRRRLLMPRGYAPAGLLWELAQLGSPSWQGWRAAGRASGAVTAELTTPEAAPRLLSVPGADRPPLSAAADKWCNYSCPGSLCFGCQREHVSGLTVDRAVLYQLNWCVL